MMGKKLSFSILGITLAVAAGLAVVIGNNAATNAAPPSSALAALPASDFVISVDVQRFLNDTLPALTAGNPALMARFNASLKEFEQKTGINPRVFESVAIGGHLSRSKSTSSDGVVIVRGSFEADKLLASAFASASKECEIEREEQQYEGKTIILIKSVKPLNKIGEPTTSGAVLSGEPLVRAELHAKAVAAADAENASSRHILRADRSALIIPSHIRGNMAIAILDSNMLAVGSLENVRAAIDASLGRNRVDEELVRLASQTPGAVVSFGGILPASTTDKIKTGDPFSRYFGSIRQFYGSLNATGDEGDAVLAFRTDKLEEANDIGDALNSMKSLVALGFASSGDSSARGNALADVLRDLHISTQGNEVQISVKLRLSAIAPLIRHR